MPPMRREPAAMIHRIGGHAQSSDARLARGRIQHTDNLLVTRGVGMDRERETGVWSWWKGTRAVRATQQRMRKEKSMLDKAKIRRPRRQGRGWAGVGGWEEWMRRW